MARDADAVGLLLCLELVAASWARAELGAPPSRRFAPRLSILEVVCPCTHHGDARSISISFIAVPIALMQMPSTLMEQGVLVGCRLALK